MIEQVIQLDMLKEPGRVPPRATVRRGESQTQKITARLTLDGAAYTPTYSDARLRILHEDGTWAACSATKATASVTATLPSNCLSKAGRCRLAYFEFSSTNGYAETTENFELVILENVDGNGSDEAANYDDELLQLWNKWSAYEKQAEEQEEARVDAEAARAKAETSRVAAESSRASAESERASAESARATAETARANAEGDRASAESSRVSAESARAEAESSRVTAEGDRASAESSRVTAETAREEACAEAIEAASTATAGAEKVNATLSGSVLTVTDRTGASSSVDTGDKSELEERIGGVESLIRADGKGVEVVRKADGSYTSGRLTVSADGVTTNGAALSAGAVTADSLTATGNVKGTTVTSTGALTAASATVSGNVKAGSVTSTGALTAASATVSGATSTKTLSVSSTASVSSSLTAGSVVTPTITSTGGMTIKANGGSSNILLNNMIVGNNGADMNWLTTDTLYWGSTLLGGRVGAKLWSGTLSKGGSITVSNLNRYRVLYAEAADHGVKMIGINDPNLSSISFSTQYDNGSQSISLKALVVKTSNTSTTIKLSSCSYHTWYGTAAGNLNLINIYGLI